MTFDLDAPATDPDVSTVEGLVQEPEDLVLAAWAAGPSCRESRRLVRDAWDLAQKVTHGDLGRVDAFRGVAEGGVVDAAP